MDGYTLPPDLEQFAADEVAAGRFGATADVVRAAMDLFKRRQQAKAELLSSVIAAQDEGERTGYLSPDEVANHVRSTIARRAASAG